MFPIRFYFIDLHLAHFEHSVWVSCRELSEFGSLSPSQPVEPWDMTVTQDFRLNYREETPGCWLKRAGTTRGSRGGGSVSGCRRKRVRLGFVRVKLASQASSLESEWNSFVMRKPGRFPISLGYIL